MCAARRAGSAVACVAEIILALSRLAVATRRRCPLHRRRWYGLIGQNTGLERPDFHRQVEDDLVRPDFPRSIRIVAYQNERSSRVRNS